MDEILSELNIVSLLPSATEIICELGFEEQLVGRSHECKNPPSVKKLPAVTNSSVKNTGRSDEINDKIQFLLKQGLSIFNVNTELLTKLEPDIIFTQDHCEVCAASLDDVKAAVKQSCGESTEVVSVSPKNLSEVFESFHTIGKALGAGEKSVQLEKELKLRLNIIKKTVIGEPVKRVACIEWIKPLMTGGNWIPELLEIAGGEYLLSEPGKHSPWITWKQLFAEDPDVILIMPCGYTLEQTQQEVHLLEKNDGWTNLRAVKDGDVYLLDGDRFFNRPGPGIYESARILGEILHPDLFKPVHQNDGWIPMEELKENMAST